MSLITELRRRNVIRVAMAYVALAWLVVQVLDSLAPLFGMGEATARLIVVLMAIGLVPVLVVSWLFELTPGGFKRERDVDHDAAASRAAARRLDRAIIGVLALAVIYFAVDKFVIDPGRDARLVTEAVEQARDEALVESYGERSIAVLPFVDASADGDQEYMADGVAEEIINLLSMIRDIRVISRSSSFAFKGQQTSLAEVAQRLNVRYIMDGSVRRAGDRLRISAQMIDPRTDTALWSENYDRPFGDVFAIQDEIAAMVVDKLEIELTGAMPTRRVVDAEAYALYLRARELVNLQNWTATQEAEEFLEQSLAIDDQHPEAWLLYWRLNGQKIGFADWTWPEWALETRHAVEMALKVDPNHTKARAYLARLSFAAMSTFEGEAQATAYGMSLEPLDPDFNAAVGGYFRSIGYPERGVPYLQYATDRDPLSAAYWRGLMACYLYSRKPKEGLGAFRRLHDIVGKTGGFWNKGMLHLLDGDPDASLAAFTAWREAQPNSPHGLHGLVLAHNALGNDSARDAALAELEQVAPESVLVISAYAWLDRADDAVDIIESTMNPPRNFGPTPMRSNVLLPGLDEDPRWEELLLRQGTADEQIATWRLDELFPGPGLPPTIPVDPP
jgi:adenylate cyclase